MGRLFWKFFWVFWLVMTMTGGIVTAVFLLRHKAEMRTDKQTFIDLGNTTTFVDAASLILRHNGVAQLRSFLGELSNQGIPPSFAVNELGEEVLNRKLPHEILGQTLGNGKVDTNEAERVKANDGQTYRIFILLPEHLGDQLPHIATLSALNHSPDGFPGLHPQPPAAPFWLPITLGIISSLIASGLLAWYLAKPIRQLRLAFAAVASGDLNTRSSEQMGNRRDELADLGKSFDHMVGQLQILMEAQQRLLHDVSHELRSPLARMQAAIGLAHQQPSKMPITLTRIEKETQRMSDLIGELLVLSRAKSGVIGSQEVIDINTLVTEIVEGAKLEAEHKAVAIELTILSDTSIKGHHELIRRAIENVLRNAVQHTRYKSTVYVDLSSDTSSLHVEIKDQGPGIAEAEMSSIFDPFFRGSNTKKAPSSGLGLAIALKAIESHNGKIFANNRPEGGLCVEIILPMVSSYFSCE